MKKLDSRGETLIELLVTTFIISISLLTILSIFMATRQGTESAWSSTHDSELSGALMEQIRSVPYTALWQLKQQQQDAVNGSAEGIDVRSSGLNLQIDPNLANDQVTLDLANYQSYPDNQLMAVTIHVYDTIHTTSYVKTDIVRKDDNP